MKARDPSAQGFRITAGQDREGERRPTCDLRALDPPEAIALVGPCDLVSNEVALEGAHRPATRGPVRRPIASAVLGVVEVLLVDAPRHLLAHELAEARGRGRAGGPERLHAVGSLDEESAMLKWATTKPRLPMRGQYTVHSRT